VTYDVNVPDYDTCSDYQAINATTNNCSEIGYSDWNSTHCKIDYTCQIGSHTEQRWKYDWVDKALRGIQNIGSSEIRDEWEPIAIGRAGIFDDTLEFKLDFDHPLVDRKDSWGSKGILWLDLGNRQYVDLNHSSWWNDSWSYRTNITINNTQLSTTLTNYQKVLNISFVSGKMNSDFSDLRFTWYNSSAGTQTEMSYCLGKDCGTVYFNSSWRNLTKVNSNYADVIVKVPSIGASSYETVYVYYGNTSVVSSKSSPDDTYAFYDKPYSATLNASKWTVLSGTWIGSSITLPDGTSGYGVNNSVSGSSTKQTVKTTSVGSDNVTIEAWMSPSNTTPSKEGVLALRLTDNDNHYMGGHGMWDHYSTIAKHVSGSYTELNSTGGETDGWKKIYFRISGTNLYLLVDNIERSLTDSSISSGNYAGLTSWNNATFYDIKVRKYASPEPSYTIGTQETSGVGNETSGRLAIVQGIQNVLGNSAIIYTDQQVYIRNSTNYQQLSRFDKVTKFGNQIWAFNYVTGTESFTNMPSLGITFNVLEMANTSTDSITTTVSNFINQTKVS
jgi:hypothetical protein